MLVQPYLFFNGRCEEACEFYRRAVGAELTALMRYSDSPDPHPPGTVPPGMEHKIMHASLRIGDSTVMASDGVGSAAPRFEGFSLSISADDAAHAERLFSALAEGGQVRMALAKTFFAARFGMLSDRFGVAWMVLTAP